MVGCLWGCSSNDAPTDAGLPDGDASPVDTGVVDAMPEAEAAAPPTVTATLRKITGVAVAASADVVATPGAQVDVDYGDDVSYGRRSKSATVPPSGELSVPLLAVTPAATLHARVTVSNEGGSAHTDDLQLATDPMPHEMGLNLDVPVKSPGLDGYFLISLSNFAAKVVIDVMIDRDGRIVWYWDDPPLSTGVPARPSHFTRIGSNFLVFDDATNRWLHRDLFGTIQHAFVDTGSTMNYLDSHDYVDLGSGRVMTIGWDYHEFDSTPYFTGGSATAQRNDNTIDVVDESGKLYEHVSTYDFIGPDEVIEDDSGLTTIDPNNVEIAHMNSLDVGADGTVLASMRATSSVIKVDLAAKKLLWRLGGKKSDFTFVDDPLGGFTLQHDVRWVPGESEIYVLDNGNNHKPPVTRACRYALDESKKTATLLWSYTHDPPLFSPFAGNVRTLPNGHLVVAYAQRGTVTEIDPTTKKVYWEMATKYFALYRALFVPTLYP